METDRPGPTVLTDVNVIDTADGAVTAHQDVFLADGRITHIGHLGSRRHDGSNVVEGVAGRFLVPGLVDMHAHPLNAAVPDNALELMLAFGITGFRQMSGSPKLLAQRRNGTLALPIRSPRLLAMPGDLLTPINAGTPERAVDEVVKQVAEGADFVKVGLVTPEAFFPAQKEAVRLGIPILGHLPAGIDVRAASRDRMRSIEHLGPGLGVLRACSSDEEALIAAIPGPSVEIPSTPVPLTAQEMGKIIAQRVVNPMQQSKLADISNFERAVDTFDEGKARALARQFVEDGTWHCPTLIRLKTQELCDSLVFRHDPDLRYLSSKVLVTWRDAADSFQAKFTERARATLIALYQLQLRLVRIFDEEGVAMSAGADTYGAVWVVPGASLHREFDELARAGLSPLRVLQMATLDPARFLGIEGATGTVDEGKDADLVLLDADPTRDSAHLHALAGVVRSGRYFSSVAVNRMREEIAIRREVD